MKVVIGSGCMGYGIKEAPEDLREFLLQWVNSLNPDVLEEIVIATVDNYGECSYSDDEPCDSCGDYYSEYTLEV